MKQIRMMWCALVVSVIASASPAFGLSYFGYNDWGGTWQDVNKNWNDDSNLCWAGAASNILEWGGWNSFADNTEQKIFDEFKEHWTNQGSWSKYGWNWWLNGTLPPNQTNWAQVNVSGGGNYWSGQNFWNYYHEEWDTPSTMGAVGAYLQSGYGVTLSVYKGSSGHALTVWGYDYEPDGIYQNFNGVWVTDSDDNTTTLKRLSVNYNLASDSWELGDSYSGWYVGGVQALDRSPVACGRANAIQQGIIQAGQNVKCSATNSLTLKPGFHAQAGSTFRGYIQAAGAGSSLLANIQSVSTTTAMDIVRGAAGGSHDDILPVAGNAPEQSNAGQTPSVPEPTTLLLLAAGMLALFGVTRKKK